MAEIAPLKGAVTIVSGKGGVAKSETTVDLAGGLCSLGLPVTVLDLDYGASTTRRYGYTPKAPYAQALLDGKAAIGQVQLDTEEGVKLIPTNADIAHVEAAKTAAWRDRLMALKRDHLLVIDTSDDIMSAPVSAAILAADVLVVPTPLNDVTYERTFPEIGGLLKAAGHNPEQIWIATLVTRKTKLSEDMEQTIARDGRELAVRVPMGVAALEAKRKQVSVIAYDRKSSISKAYLDLAKLVYARLRRLNGATPDAGGREVPDLVQSK